MEGRASLSHDCPRTTVHDVVRHTVHDVLRQKCPPSTETEQLATEGRDRAARRIDGPVSDQQTDANGGACLAIPRLSPDNCPRCRETHCPRCPETEMSTFD